MRPIQATIDLAALVGNLAVVRHHASGARVWAVVKADAYGHGLMRLLPALRQADGLALLELDAALALRQAGYERPLLMLEGFFSADELEAFSHARLTAVMHCHDQLATLERASLRQPVDVYLKFNTGMNRLGLSLGMAQSIAKLLRGKPASWHPAGVFSHLAMGEAPESRLSRMQLERFIAIRSELSSALPGTRFHLANSAGIWNHKKWGLHGLTDVVRPGLSLYGVTPWKGAPERGIKPVMTLKASVLTVHRLKRGESVDAVPLEDVECGLSDDEADELIVLDEALGRLERIDPRSAEVVQHRFFGGLTLDETAQALGVSTKTVQRDWLAARAWLRKEVAGELELLV